MDCDKPTVNCLYEIETSGASLFSFMPHYIVVKIKTQTSSIAYCMYLTVPQS